MNGKVVRQNIDSQGLRLDRSNPITRDLVACVMLSQGGGNKVRELARDRVGSLSAGAWITTPRGTGRDYRSPTGLISFAPAFSEYDITGDITIEAMIDGFSVPVFGPPGVFSIFSKAGAGVGFDLQVYYDGAGAYFFGLAFNTSAGAKAAQESIGYFSPATGRYHIVARLNRNQVNAYGQYLSLFKNGALTPISYRTGSDGNQALVPATLDILTMAGLNVAPYNNLGSIFYWGRLWKRALSDSEIISLYKRPFEMFTRKNRTAVKKITRIKDTTFLQYKIIIYDSDYRKIGELSNETNQRLLQAFEFELNSTGCGAFQMTLAEIPEYNIARNDIVEVYLFNQSEPYYCGFVQSIPETGRTDRVFKFSGYGFVAKLDEIVINRTYTSTEISAIATNILETYVIPATNIIENPAKIVATLSTLTEVVYDYAKAKKAIFDLLQSASGYLTGVDEFREFFFLPIDNAIQSAAIKAVEKHLTDFLPKEDISKIVNRLYVKCGANTDGSNYILTINDATSQADYGLKEGVATVPTMTQSADVNLWAQRTLNQVKDPLITASVKNIDMNFIREKITATGKARILLRPEK